ncbi:MAG: diheme cytochrome c [Candidatus Thiodiazotropha sp.]
MNIESYRVSLLFLFLFLLAVTSVAVADRDDDRGEHFFSRWFKHEMKVNNPEQRKLYQEECGSCHFPFQPGFLPVQSWREMMLNLDDHFGENAELEDEERDRLLGYLTSNSADRINAEIPNKVMWSLRYKPSPKRITETAFFRHEHDEIPSRVMQRLKDKVSFSNCDGCHTRAMQGSYDEHEIDIPGMGPWDD